MSSSRAIRQDRWGGEETLQLVEVDMPRPLPSEVVVRVVAAGVNPVDIYTREGLAYRDAVFPPFVPGWDVAGVVEALGYGVTRFAVGDEVFGMPWFPRPAGAYADRVTAPSRHFAPKPATASFEEAAALPLAGLTAWQMLVDVGRVGPGDRVLVTGAAGGVGHLAVQIARARGAHVIAQARPARHDFVRTLGADEVIGAEAGRLASAVSDVDVVIELVGDLCIEALGVLRPGGLLVSALSGLVPGLHGTAAELGVRASGYLVEPDPVGLGELAALVDAGRLRVHVDAVFPLEEAAAAHRALGEHRVVGKAVLRVAP
jgi:NADPH:quinone reductase-like Zn-dependent oxidoreductase